VKLNGEDLPRYWNKIESVGLRKYPYYHCHIKKVCHSNKHFTELAPYHGDEKCHIYGMNKLCH